MTGILEDGGELLPVRVLSGAEIVWQNGRGDAVCVRSDPTGLIAGVYGRDRCQVQTVESLLFRVLGNRPLHVLFVSVRVVIFEMHVAAT